MNWLCNCWYIHGSVAGCRQTMLKTTTCTLTCICCPTTSSSSLLIRIPFSTTGKPTPSPPTSLPYPVGREIIRPLGARSCCHCPGSTVGQVQRFSFVAEPRTVHSSTLELPSPRLNHADELHLWTRIRAGHLRTCPWDATWATCCSYLTATCSSSTELPMVHKDGEMRRTPC